MAIINVMDVVTIASLGDATDFGDLTEARRTGGAASSKTRGLAFGGEGSGASSSVTIDYWTFASAGNATDFGDLQATDNRYYGTGCVCDGAKALVAGGGSAGGVINEIDTINVSSTGDATDHGDLSVSRSGLGGCSHETYGVFGGGSTGSAQDSDVIDYVAIATTGNATDFGDLTNGRDYIGGNCSDNVRAQWASGYESSVSVNIIDSINIASTGNATDFGDLTVARNNADGFNDATKGCCSGGYQSNVIDYWVMASPGNASDFGDLTVARSEPGGCSGT